MANNPRSTNTELVAAAERLGVGGLVKLCERALVDAVQGDLENARACADFSKQFNLLRLQRHCASLLLDAGTE